MTDKPNYNDGNWHGWDGVECPVHPKSEVECLSGAIPGNRNVHIRLAGDLIWDCIVAFRVIKEYREPREFWIHRDGSNEHFGVSFTAPAAHWNEVIHVREVTK